MTLSTNRGFTLVETLAAVAILGVSFAALASLQLTTVRATDLARTFSAATRLAQDKLEELKGDSAPVASAAPETLTDSAAEGGAAAVYERSWTVAANTPVAGTRTITVTVAWRDRGRRSVELETVVMQ